ncbi:hypothetical protein F5Y16DRAFT_399833 [Xylariaceae sp. FL0255]|nr:hypothetical protein F5Y16DRAFT_399833 [Xylariaceae sp. FL0255]
MDVEAQTTPEMSTNPIVDIDEVNNYRSRLDAFIMRKMPEFAPNLSMLLGPMAAAKLLTKAGSMKELATMHNNAIEKKLRGDIFAECDLIQRVTVRKNRKNMARMLAAKCALCARIDFFSPDPGAEDCGFKYRKQLEQHLQRPKFAGMVVLPKKPLPELVVSESEEYFTAPESNNAAKFE